MNTTEILVKKSRKSITPSINEKVLPNGTKVTFMLGATPYDGMVAGYRGAVGFGGRHLYRIEFFNGDELYSLDLPTSELKVVI